MLSTVGREWVHLKCPALAVSAYFDLGFGPVRKGWVLLSKVDFKVKFRWHNGFFYMIHRTKTNGISDIIACFEPFLI